MKLDAISAQPVVISGGMVRSGTAAVKSTEPPAVSANKLPEGEVVQARVLSVGDGTASLRTKDGALLQARLENGVALSPGADVYLLVRESGSDAVIMTQVNPPAESAVTQPSHPADPFITEIFNQLTALGYEPTEEIMSAVEQLLTETPGLTIKEAAFFTAQKLDTEPAILDAFRAVTSGENDTVTLLGKLATVSAALTEVFASQTSADLSASLPSTAVPPEAAVLPQATSAVALDNTAIPADTAAAQPEIIALNGLISTSIISDGLPETQNMQTEASVFTGNNITTAKTDSTAFGKWLLEALGAASSTPNESTLAVTSEALASSPLLDGLSERNLAGMAESLNRIADSIPKASTETELFDNIARFTKELFVRLDGKENASVQERLKSVREELYIKLAYFKDAVASSSSAVKEVVLDQTQKLMDHLRLLNALDRFVCMQIPVQTGDRNTNADIYIYKRKKSGSAKIDPENVKILLALELTHMGKLETMIEILGRDVSLRFEVENDDVANELRYNSTQIHKLLDEAGFKFTGSTFTTKRSGTTIETALLTLLESETRHGGMDMLL